MVAFFLVHRWLFTVCQLLCFFPTLLFLFPSLEFWLDLVISRYSYSSFLYMKIAFVLCFAASVSGV